MKNEDAASLLKTFGNTVEYDKFCSNIHVQKQFILWCRMVWMDRANSQTLMSRVSPPGLATQTLAATSWLKLTSSSHLSLHWTKS